MTAAVPAPRQGLLLLATGLGLFMIFLDATIVNVALPDIQSDFDVGEAGIQWVVAAYTLTMGMFMMSAAAFADSRGRRRAYLAGLVLFSVASIGCAVAPGLVVLNLFRGLQGVGAGIVNVASLALVSAAFDDEAARAKAIGVWTGIAAVGLAAGPTVGGVLTETFDWRSIFVVNPVIGGIAIVLTLRFVGESRDPIVRRLDGAGQLLFIVAVGALTYGLVEGPHKGWASAVILSCLVGSAVLIAVFAWVELRTRDPMMDVRVFADPVYTTAIVTVFAVLFALYGTLLIITQYLQNVRDYSPEQAGLVMLAMTVPTIIFAPIAGRLVARVGARRPTLAGVTAVCAGCAVLALTTGGWLGWTMIGLIGPGIAGGLAISPATHMAMSSIPADRSGMASGILSAQRALGSTAGFAIMGSVLAAVVASVLPGYLEDSIPDEGLRDEVAAEVAEAANPRAVVSLIGPRQPLADYVPESDEIVDEVDDAFVTAIRAAIAVGFAVSAAALVLGWVVFPRGTALIGRGREPAPSPDRTARRVAG